LTWRPGGPWSCTRCDRSLSGTSLRPSTRILDAIVARTVAEQRVRLLREGVDRDAFNRGLRLRYVAGVEELSRAVRGRGLTNRELRRALLDYPGDLPTDRVPPTER
jgi:hypothetical protein